MHDQRRRREPGETLFGFVLLLMSLAVMAEGHRLRGFEEVSAPGITPLAAGVVMAISALVIILRTRTLVPTEAGFATRIAPRDIALSVLMIAIYMALLEPIGFHIATFAFLSALILYLRRGGPASPLRGLGFALLLALVSVVAVHVVFRMVFTVVLPQGWMLRSILPPGWLL
ncbi:tripartite tricarboxylate transporter TctB family protein [Falsiroseomonas sp.]|uniref:tripartite tricarboxylate transporter TctB family protein n=1 Tax=Falsiroseomonas sp. TaxID=2870721 RepID=UPI002720A17F|nr:tripartite tricarboxylate transporter TctB family protein [Falsiroseomonas sp.]MDO9499883.1 tripartite tricarboxylate transporter TctB family protein [Falsiroseomonas sp.]MDP3416397.1 tripartite tricarboxylate transporter TctB family protein [Falsiroseomonas sp.]